MQVLKIQNLSKSYGRIKALNELNLEVEKGQVYGILGPNGSGKTTTLGIILGILKQNTGSFEWFGGEFGSNPRKKIGAILETPNFYPYLNAIDNLDIISHIKGVKERNYDELLSIMDLEHRKKSNFSTYSLGMKQRLAIAATMIGDPEVVIFDEPTNGLDPQGIADVRNILLRIAESGKTVIMASHILDEVEKICSHVAIIKNGHLLAKGRVGSILTNELIVEINVSDREKLIDLLNKTTGIRMIDMHDQFIECSMDEQLIDATKLSELIAAEQLMPTHFKVRKRSLEEEFLSITKN